MGGGFENDEAPARSAKGLKLIFRGVNIDNSNKALLLVKALAGILRNYIQENCDLFEKMLQP